MSSESVQLAGVLVNEMVAVVFTPAAAVIVTVRPLLVVVAV